MRRAGYTLPEVMAALALSGMVAVLAGSLLQSQARIARDTAERARRTEALRTASHVLTTELRWLTPDTDLRVLNSDSLTLRAFRGRGIVCAYDDLSALLRYTGLRSPDAAKDSVLVLRDTMYEAAVALQAAAPAAAGCITDASEQLQRVVVGIPLRVGDVLAFFESGTYYLTANALRYRLGAEGRQPITAELFDGRVTRFAPLVGSFAEAVLGTRAQVRLTVGAGVLR